MPPFRQRRPFCKSALGFLAFGEDLDLCSFAPPARKARRTCRKPADVTAHHAVAFLKQQELHVEEKSSDQPDYVRDSNELLDDEECAELQQILGLQVEEEEPSSREPVAESWSLVSGDSSSWCVISG